jgi:hypothetical protein
MIGILIMRHPQDLARDLHESPIGGIAPSVVWTAEDGCVAFVVSANSHSSMTASVEKDVQLALTIPGKNYRLFAHPRHEVVVWIGDLALMAYKEPAAREYPLELLLVEFIAHKYLAAYFTCFQVDEATGPRIGVIDYCHANLPGHKT